MITKITITQKKGKTANGIPTVDVQISLTQKPAGGDIKAAEAIKLLIDAMQMIVESKTASNAQG
jgi:hypothetical protein